MKLFVLKLLSLLVLLSGLVLIGLNFGCSFLIENFDKVGIFLDELGDSATYLWVALGGVLTLVGLYAFLPRLPKGRKAQSITFEGEYGDVVVQLAPLELMLNRVLNNMPEVKKIRLQITPDEEKRRAVITADALLESQTSMPARKTANLVSDYIAETAINTLGLEDLATIRLNISGINVNPKASSEQLREQLLARQKEAEATAPVQVEEKKEVEAPSVMAMEAEEVAPVEVEQEEVPAVVEEAPEIQEEEETPLAPLAVAPVVASLEEDEAGEEDVQETEETEEVEETSDDFVSEEAASELEEQEEDASGGVAPDVWSMQEETSDVEQENEEGSNRDRWSF